MNGVKVCLGCGGNAQPLFPVCDSCEATSITKKLYDMDGMIIKSIKYNKLMWLEVEGKIDTVNASELKTCIDKLIEEGFNIIVLEMSEVKFFSSNGIRVVLSTYKNLHGEGSFHITNPSRTVANVLGMVALDQILLK